MLAARLHSGKARLRFEEVPVPEPAGDAVLVRVVGAGVCGSDIHILDGMFDDLVRRPVTLGHEVAGRVEAAGPAVRDLEYGEPVVVGVGWGCGHCDSCVSGHEQLCPRGDEAGATVDGGFAEYVLVPNRRHVVPLGDLDPLEATPYGCAALCSYAAAKRVRPHLPGGSTCVIVGGGGLGQYGIQFVCLLSGASIIVVEPRVDLRPTLESLGAEHVIAPSAQAAETIHELTCGRGAQAVVDLVGTDESLALAARVVAARGMVALLGLAGGRIPFDFSGSAPEAVFTTVVAGTLTDLHEVVRLGRAGRFSGSIRTYPLVRIDDALEDLRSGRVDGRAVVMP
jgi:propanol-preferring alcohol dehydrogenase